MKDEKIASFWETEEEIRIILLSVNDQLELTFQALNARLLELQEKFRRLTQLGEELGFNVDNLSVKEWYDYIMNNELLQMNDSLLNNIEADQKH